MISVRVWNFIRKRKGEIFTAFLFLLFFILWFTIERMSGKIDGLNHELEDREREITILRSELDSVKISVAGVKLYLERLSTISANEQQELKTNEDVCQTVTDFDSIIPRLNELFGNCSE